MSRDAISPGPPSRLAWATLRGAFPDPRAAAARAAEAAQPFGADVQLVDPAALASERHLRSAALHAERAHAEGRARTGGLALELLRYVTGERQIRHVLETGGLKPGAREAVAVALGGDAEGALRAVARALGAEADARVAWRGAAALGATAVGEPEAERAALERVALLDLER